MGISKKTAKHRKTNPVSMLRGGLYEHIAFSGVRLGRAGIGNSACLIFYKCLQ